jgi:transposase
MDDVRRREYARLTGKHRRLIKGQRYNLLARRDNLTLVGRQVLTLLFRANKPSNTAYLLKESLGRLCDYNRLGRARRCFVHWKDALTWQSLEPIQSFAAIVETHWDDIGAYRREENKVPLGFVAGLNRKIRALRRRAYG